MKLPVAPDPLQSFLAAVGAPALQPEPDAPAPEQALGAAVSGAPSVMPTAAAAAPERQLPGGFPDPLSLPGAGSLFPDIFAEAPALPVAAKVGFPGRPCQPASVGCCVPGSTLALGFGLRDRLCTGLRCPQKMHACWQTLR